MKELPFQTVFLIMDVFTGGMTELVFEKLAWSNIQIVKVPFHLTHIYKPTDVRIDGVIKQFMKTKFVIWYATQIVTETGAWCMYKSIGKHLTYYAIIRSRRPEVFR